MKNQLFSVHFAIKITKEVNRRRPRSATKRIGSVVHRWQWHQPSIGSNNEYGKVCLFVLASSIRLRMAIVRAQQSSPRCIPDSDHNWCDVSTKCIFEFSLRVINRLGFLPFQRRCGCAHGCGSDHVEFFAYTSSLQYLCRGYSFFIASTQGMDLARKECPSLFPFS